METLDIQLGPTIVVAPSPVIAGEEDVRQAIEHPNCPIRREYRRGVCADYDGIARWLRRSNSTGRLSYSITEDEPSRFCFHVMLSDVEMEGTPEPRIRFGLDMVLQGGYPDRSPQVYLHISDKTRVLRDGGEFETFRRPYRAKLNLRDLHKWARETWKRGAWAACCHSDALLLDLAVALTQHFLAHCPLAKVGEGKVLAVLRDLREVDPETRCRLLAIGAALEDVDASRWEILLDKWSKRKLVLLRRCEMNEYPGVNLLAIVAVDECQVVGMRLECASGPEGLGPDFEIGAPQNVLPGAKVGPYQRLLPRGKIGAGVVQLPASVSLLDDMGKRVEAELGQFVLPISPPAAREMALRRVGEGNRPSAEALWRYMSRVSARWFRRVLVKRRASAPGGSEEAIGSVSGVCGDATAE